MIKFFKRYHKWIGLFFSFFIVISAFSGIVLNHRQFFSRLEISRSLLPKSYHYDNWNNGAVRGSIKLSLDSILVYGGAGIWLTDASHTSFTEYAQGLKQGADNRITNRIVKTSGNNLFAVTTFDLYQWSEGNGWKNTTEEAGINGRISDLTVKDDSLIVITRSHIFISTAPYKHFTQVEIKSPANYSSKTSLFRFLWLLHSGELFGLPGKLFVDTLGLLLIILCVTGVTYTFCPGIIKRKKKKDLPVKKSAGTMKFSIKWHNKIGVVFLVFFIILTLSGMFLRPPLMIAVIRSKVKPIPGSVLDDKNPWRDQLRCLRFDSHNNDWILYASSGFYRLDGINSIPQKIMSAPPVSVMGVNVLEPTDSGWLAGSFSGLFHWDRKTGEIIDCYTQQPVVQQRPSGRPTFNHTVSGFSSDFSGKAIVFEYGSGAQLLETKSGEAFAAMPSQVKDIPMSLWHFCIELHVGRAYQPFIGPFSDLFIFISGLLMLFILVSGYVVYKKRFVRKKK